MFDWNAPESWRKITSIDAHTEGEPLRIITSGFPDLPGETILQKRQYAMQHHDDLRKMLMFEPRGHADMYGAILTPPVTDDGDIGVLFIHNEGFSTMCGHGIIALTKVGVETGLFPVSGDKRVVKIDSPAGRVTATAHMKDGRVDHVSFLNVPSFLYKPDLSLEIPTLGEVQFDIAFGGAFYAYVDVEQLGLKVDPEHYNQLIDSARKIKHEVMQKIPLEHPEGDADLGFLYGVIFVDMKNMTRVGVHSRNACIFAEGEVDRSPTGTGVSGRLAIHHAKGELGLGELVEIESIIGSSFKGKVSEITQVGELSAIIPEVSGMAYITGKHEFLIDPNDPLWEGFILR